MEVRSWGRTGYSGDRRWLDSNPDEDLLMAEAVFLSLPEINKYVEIMQVPLNVFDQNRAKAEQSVVGRTA